MKKETSENGTVNSEEFYTLDRPYKREEKKDVNADYDGISPLFSAESRQIMDFVHITESDRKIVAVTDEDIHRSFRNGFRVYIHDVPFKPEDYEHEHEYMWYRDFQKAELETILAHMRKSRIPKYVVGVVMSEGKMTHFRRQPNTRP